MNSKRILWTTTAAVLCCGALTAAWADVPAKIELSNGNVIDKCTLRWMPASKKYAVTMGSASGGQMEQQMSPSEISRKLVAPPAGWKELVGQVSKSPDAALPKLMQIVESYKMLEYDEQAAYIAGTILLRKGRADEVIKLCEKVALDNPKASTVSVMAPVYWSALVATGKTAGGTLSKMLNEAVASAPRPVAAQALIVRGDMLKKEGRTADALKDGYLRCVFLFVQEKTAHAEALYKASLAFDELHQPTYAERMRQTLLTDHKDSEFARKLRGN